MSQVDDIYVVRNSAAVCLIHPTCYSEWIFALNHRNKSSAGICYKSYTYWPLKTFHYALFCTLLSTSISVIERFPFLLSYLVLSSSWILHWILPVSLVSFLSVTKSRRLTLFCATTAANFLWTFCMFSTFPSFLWGWINPELCL